jgi:hypothetical protein
MQAASIKTWTAKTALDPSRNSHWRISILELRHLSESRPVMLIKLNHKGVRAYMASGRTHYRTPLDWKSRIGSIVKYSRNRSIAYVVWNGRSSYDPVSVDLIEPATSLAPDIADALVSDRGVDNGVRIVLDNFGAAFGGLAWPKPTWPTPTG